MQLWIEREVYEGEELKKKYTKILRVFVLM